MSTELMLDFILPKINKTYSISYGFDILRKAPIRPSFSLINKLRSFINQVYGIDGTDLIEILNLISGSATVELVFEKSIFHENGKIYTGTVLQVNNVLYYLHMNILII